MQIREIEARDNQAIETIIKRSLESFGLDIPGTAYVDPQLHNLADFYAKDPYAKYWVAENEDGEIVGGVGIGPFHEEDNICELQKLYVAPKAQGRGVAYDLMNVALAFAKQHYDACYLETSTKLDVANRLYEKLGFERLSDPIEGSDHNAMDAWYLKPFSS
ncbi:GNAT family N-acetyltransferase [Alkalibacillus salilacus]|uniref:Acetyltransferase n=1 Tax=Alkalibacillus salilacus TaxID=284582 RepID=A0ABT9VAZ6_9BACI|nr:GNAT family N-acetyltransferase [Alkalibacillus salilacus]MDQ0158118.1 putative acetyltransferase [Alkalibacillus salilacus]